MIDYVNREVMDKPEEYYTLAKLRKARGWWTRRLTLREILEKVFDIIPRFKSKDELLEEEFAKFVADHQPEAEGEAEAIPVIKAYFKAYATAKRSGRSLPPVSSPDLRPMPRFAGRLRSRAE